MVTKKLTLPVLGMQKSLSGGTGRRARLKIVCLRACRFDSGLRYESLQNTEGFLFYLRACRFVPIAIGTGLRYLKDEKCILFRQQLLLLLAAVYILCSEKLDRFYTGSCLDFQFRFEEHLHKVYPGSFTSNSDDWRLFFLLENQLDN